MDYKIACIITVTCFSILTSLVYGDDTTNERLHRQRRQTGAGGAYSSSGTFAWWKIVLVVGGGLAAMEILYCCCKNYLRNQGSDENEKNTTHKTNDSHSGSSVTINEQSVNHMRKNNSFIEAMKPQGYPNFRDNMYQSVEFCYPTSTTAGIAQTTYPQKNTFYVDQTPIGLGHNLQYTHHLIPVAGRPNTQWGHKMHPLLGASTFV